MRKHFNWLTTTSVVVGLCMAGSAFATNGYFTHGTGTKNKAMAGAGIALPEDAIDIANNPAVAPFVGDQLVVGAALFSPVRKYETYCTNPPMCANGNGGAFTIGPNSLKSKNELFFIPHIGKSWQLENDSAWALLFYGRGGMDTEWQGGTATFDPDGPGPAGPMTLPGTYGEGLFGTDGRAGVNLNQAFLDVTWAKKINDRVSLGASAVLVAQTFKAFGILTFSQYTETFAQSSNPMMPDMPQYLSNNGTEWSYGAGIKLGLHSALSDRVDFGISYQSKIFMSELDDYADLFAEQGDFDIPADLKLGLTFHANENIDLSFDIEHIWYSDVDSVGNSIANLFACPTAGFGGTNTSFCLGGDNGGGFGWDDMTVFKLGMAWRNNEDWTWRFGYSYGKQPIPESEMSFNILAPATIESHLTAGFTLERTPGRQFNMAFMFAPNSSVQGTQNFDPTQTVKFEMYQWEIEASYSWRF